MERNKDDGAAAEGSPAPPPALPASSVPGLLPCLHSGASVPEVEVDVAGGDEGDTEVEGGRLGGVERDADEGDDAKGERQDGHQRKQRRLVGQGGDVAAIPNKGTAVEV